VRERFRVLYARLDTYVWGDSYREATMGLPWVEDDRSVEDMKGQQMNGGMLNRG
jgi:hypothetical protein